MVIAFILVFIVVYIFLQDFRSTLIPAIAVPVAIIGTFFFLQLFGFSINMLTLFALVLAIGIVVDDAIVVVEAVHSKMEQTGMPVEQATVQNRVSKAMSQLPQEVTQSGISTQKVQNSFIMFMGFVVIIFIQFTFILKDIFIGFFTSLT